MERIFTLAEAQDLLPHVRTLVEEMVAAAADVANPQRRLELSRLTEANATSEAMAPLLAPAERVARLLIALDALGIEVKDPAIGLVDFPAERDGEPVLLCWLLGESAIGFWHGPDAGFAGRTPI